jgi:hypothetical protein
MIQIYTNRSLNALTSTGFISFRLNTVRTVELGIKAKYKLF